MAINKNEIKELIKQLDFKPVEGSHELYLKSYSKHTNYIIKINFEKENIDYGYLIQKGDETTCNFENSENFVVLECVNRLLEKGYKPECLSLEHKWPMGRKEKGKLDILVYDSEKKSFLMIECKTWGDEYEKEKKKMLRDGGQLFSYFQQDKAAQYLCLYSSRLNTDIEFKNDIIKVDPQWKELNNQKEIYDHWNKNFKDNGIFESWANPYDIEIKALTRGRLKEMTEEDSGKIFNQFAEILRHNIVSDKPNAFNKIFNLFLCKIVDETKEDDEQLDFQWLEDDKNETLQIRLTDLYKFGMERYLNKTVADFSDKDIEEKFDNSSDEEKQKIIYFFHIIRLKKNNEFAFKEVFDEDSFLENAKVVKEVVELLQPYQIRYTHKQQFLGDFFELLLNTGLKQEAGQYFTPVPIAKFILSCLPIEEFIIKKIKCKDTEILPYIIDFAAGSGHFLTESMDEIQSKINTLSLNKLRQEVKDDLEIWKLKPYKWAEKYIYGIEADYRLVKTAKVSCFLNGDGMANVIHADGLDIFSKSKDYHNKLKQFYSDDIKDNCQFDILVANPPYSVSAFKNTLKNGKESFELYDRLTDNSSEIECLFIERTKQLLKPGGWAGIILPSSILSNSGIYADTREIILKYFNIIAIAEFGSNTFMATGTNTITMFLEKRKNTDWKNIKQRIDSFFQNPKEATVSGIENAFSIYTGFVFNDIELTDYISFINKNPNETIQLEELYKDYRSWFNSLTEIKDLKSKTAFKAKSLEEQKKEFEKRFYEKVFEKEKDKMLYFFLTYSQKTVIVKVGSGQGEKDFLGYEFSNRRGHEGIKMFRDSEGKLTTKLYNEDISLSADKSNYYIYNAFLKKQFNIDSSLSENISEQNLIDLFDFKKIQFEKGINISVKKKFDNFRFDLVPIYKIISVIESGSRPSGGVNKYKNGIFSLGGEHIGIDGKLNLSTPKFVPLEFFKMSIRGRVKPNDILMCKDGALTGKVALMPNEMPYSEFLINEHVFIIRTNGLSLQKFLFYFLYSECGQQLIEINITGKAQGGLNGTNLKNIQIPLPPIDIQEKIVVEIEEIEKKEKEAIENIVLKKNKSSLLFHEIKSKSNLVKVKDLALMLKRGKSANYGNSSIQIIKSGQARGYKTFDFTNKYFVDNSFFSDERNLQDGDILINSTGVGTAGRVTLFELKGNYVVDSHITILRLDKSKALPLFVLNALSDIGFKNIEAMATGQSGQIELSLSILQDIKIPLPNLEYQQLFVDEILKIESEISELENSIKDTAKQKEEILKKYL